MRSTQTLVKTYNKYSFDCKLQLELKYETKRLLIYFACKSFIMLLSVLSQRNFSILLQMKAAVSVMSGCKFVTFFNGKRTNWTFLTLTRYYFLLYSDSSKAFYIPEINLKTAFTSVIPQPTIFF